MQIADKPIGNGNSCFIVAEAGVNHNGKFSLAKKMINAAKKVGADAIKFQVFKADRVVARTAPKAAYQKTATGKGSQYEMLKKLELTGHEFKELAAYARRRNIIFLASAFDEESVDLLDELKVPAFKVPSGEITNLPLLKHIARKKKPVILSTGMSTVGEIEDAVSVIKENGTEEIALLHCTSDYPAKIEEINLKAMETLRRVFGLPVGISDHSLGINVPIAAVSLGAAIVEKHFTLDKTLRGPDHKASLEPCEFEEMVEAIRAVEKALGDGIKKLTPAEEEIKKVVRKSIVARIKIPKGVVIKEDMLSVKRPGMGIDPKHMDKIIGKRAKKDIEPDEQITFEKLM